MDYKERKQARKKARKKEREKEMLHRVLSHLENSKSPRSIYTRDHFLLDIMCLRGPLSAIKSCYLIGN